MLLIAEAGVNHNGNLNWAHDLVDIAADAGADVVKFQSFVTEELATFTAPKAEYQRHTTDPSQSQFEMLKALELPPAAMAALRDHCISRNVLFLSTPYDRPSVDGLVDLGVCGFKISSGDATNLSLLDYIGRQRLPVILSTGMCDLDEVHTAVATLSQAGAEEIALLQCTSEYPAPPDQINLRAIATLAAAFGLPVGFSDHAEGIETAAWAVAAGASIIEKHFTLDRSLPGPDHRASLNPGELRRLVETVRQVERSLGSGVKVPAPCEIANRSLMRKSLVTRVAIAAGQCIEVDMLCCKRASGGLSPHRWSEVVGQRAARTLTADEPLTDDCVAWS